MTFEFTTKIGCPVNCIKYCPQEIITKNYRGDKVLQYENFQYVLRTIPTSQTIIFSGLCEPFANPHCIDMIEYTHKMGYPIWLFTTFRGVTREISERLIEIPIKRLCIHMPDSMENASIPVTSEYLDVLGNALKFMPNLEFMNMGGLFTTNHTDEFVRGKYFPYKRGKIWCDRLDEMQYNCLPNGDVYFCCILNRFANPERKDSAVLGNLYEESFPEMLARFPAISKRLSTDPDSPCRTCPTSEKWWKKKVLSFRFSGGK